MKTEQKKTQTKCDCLSCMTGLSLFSTVIQAFQVHVGAEEEAASLAREREHPRAVRPVPSAGGQWDDRVGHAGEFQNVGLQRGGSAV